MALINLSCQRKLSVMTDIKVLEVNTNLFMEKSSFGFEEKPNKNNALPKECKKDLLYD